MKKFRYNNLFVFSSLQFIGHIEDYFVEHTEKLVVHIVMPRVKNKYNLARFYRKGKLIEEKKLWSTENIFLYYASWYIQHIYLLFRYFSKQEKFFVMSYSPLVFFFISIQQLFRNITPVFFIGDYCPAKTPAIRLFEWLKKYYHDNVLYACYLSDTINKIMNGKVVDTKNRKTVLWGVIPKKHTPLLTENGMFRLLFVGLIKDSQGLEFFYKFLKTNKNCFINVLGICNDALFLNHMQLIKAYGIEKQVYFPNKFFLDWEIEKIASTCHVGVALYDIGKDTMTYYTEPGKVKVYTEYGLPIIMSNTSAIAPFIKQFHAGEIVDRNEKSVAEVIKKIKDNYEYYTQGVKKFNAYFYYETYYSKKFTFLES